MQSIIQRLRIIYLRALVEVSDIQCRSLAREFDAATTAALKSELGHRWQGSLNERQRLRLLIKREEEVSPKGEKR
jgi:hypothetical protein